MAQDITICYITDRTMSQNIDYSILDTPDLLQFVFYPRRDTEKYFNAISEFVFKGL